METSFDVDVFLLLMLLQCSALGAYLIFFFFSSFNEYAYTLINCLTDSGDHIFLSDRLNRFQVIFLSKLWIIQDFKL